MEHKYQVINRFLEMTRRDNISTNWYLNALNVGFNTHFQNFYNKFGHIKEKIRKIPDQMTNKIPETIINLPKQILSKVLWFRGNILKVRQNTENSLSKTLGSALGLNFPSSYASDLNDKVTDYVNNVLKISQETNECIRLGTLIMDYAGEYGSAELIRSLILLNMCDFIKSKIEPQFRYLNGYKLVKNALKLNCYTECINDSNCYLISFDELNKNCFMVNSTNLSSSTVYDENFNSYLKRASNIS